MRVGFLKGKGKGMGQYTGGLPMCFTSVENGV